MTCSILSAIIASPAPNRYGRQSLLRNAANLAGGGDPAVSAVISSDGAASSISRTWVGIPQAEHIDAALRSLGVRSAWGRSGHQPQLLCLHNLFRNPATPPTPSAEAPAPADGA